MTSIPTFIPLDKVFGFVTYKRADYPLVSRLNLVKFLDCSTEIHPFLSLFYRSFLFLVMRYTILTSLLINLAVDSAVAGPCRPQTTGM